MDFDDPDDLPVQDPSLRRPTSTRAEVHKREAGKRYQSQGIDFDDGLEAPASVTTKSATPRTPAPPEPVVAPPPSPRPEEPETEMAQNTIPVATFLAQKGVVPEVLTWDAVRKAELPKGPAGEILSGLPASLERDVPSAYRFWKCEDEASALRVREALVESELFRPETILEVDGEIRRAVAEAVVKLWLPPAYDDTAPPTVPAAIREVEKFAQLLKASEAEVNTTLFDQDVVEAVGLEAIVARVGKIKGDWVICATDSPENRAIFKSEIYQLRSRGDLIFATSAELEDPASVVVVEDERPSDVLKFALSESREVRLIKSGEERIVFGIVLEPNTVDSQNDTISEAEIRQACHKFMEEYGQLGLQHGEIVNGKLKLLESFIAPVDFEVDGEKVTKGSWLMAERVVDDGLWEAVKKGALTGFSIGGSAIRRPV